MGLLYYGGAAIEIEDRTLAHVQVVVTTKLRRSESFMLSWRHPRGTAPGRSSIWVEGSIPFWFEFEDPEPADIDHEWLERLAADASTAGGIVLVLDPETGSLTVRGPVDLRHRVVG